MVSRKSKNLSIAQSRITSYIVNLISLPSLNTSEFIEKLEQYIQLSDRIVYGITKDTTTSRYMIVALDKFNSIRNKSFG
ncbi:hypothetical protein C2G38_2227598 [Gigaspora rosea]|uniref:Uncharacterized protein n=1 Tax=Gigaspora rosea TaxID=44941 RepID=A0A397TWV1_9GLOM|nr:hypothetical protein C2G38_2227598 [Gigaspora rosea]